MDRLRASCFSNCCYKSSIPLTGVLSDTFPGRVNASHGGCRPCKTWLGASENVCSPPKILIYIFLCILVLPKARGSLAYSQMHGKVFLNKKVESWTSHKAVRKIHVVCVSTVQLQSQLLLRPSAWRPCQRRRGTKMRSILQRSLKQGFTLVVLIAL